MSRSPVTQKFQPSAALWHPGLIVPESIPIDHRPFEEVFLPFTADEASRHYALDESLFIKGLEILLIRKTAEGVGLKSFLEANFNPDDRLDKMIWELYTEVMHAETQE